MIELLEQMSGGECRSVRRVDAGFAGDVRFWWWITVVHHQTLAAPRVALCVLLAGRLRLLPPAPGRADYATSLPNSACSASDR
jgi:hypothetical protein